MTPIAKTELCSTVGGAQRVRADSSMKMLLPELTPTQPAMLWPPASGAPTNHTVEHPGGYYDNGDAKDWATYKKGAWGERGDLIAYGVNPAPQPKR